MSDKPADEPREFGATGSGKRSPALTAADIHATGQVIEGPAIQEEERHESEE